MLYGPRDVRFEQRPDPTIVEPTGAILRISAACVCGSDLWPYRGIDKVTKPVMRVRGAGKALPNSSTHRRDNGDE